MNADGSSIDDLLDEAQRQIAEYERLRYGRRRTPHRNRAHPERWTHDDGDAA